MNDSMDSVRSASLNEPPPWLLGLLRTDPDPELGDWENVGSASNRHLRLLVAAWCLPLDSAGQWDIRLALRLYMDTGHSSLLDAPGNLTVTSIYAEVVRLWESLDE